MKILSCSLFAMLGIASLFAFNGFLAPSQAQQAIETVMEPVIEQPSPTLEDYEKYLAKMEKISKDFMVFDSWKEMSFKHKVTGKVVEWKDLSEYEKTMFCVVMAERTTAYFTRMDAFWKEELKSFENPNHKLVPVPNPENEKQKPATKEDVTKYVEKLTSIRKNFAVEYEKFAEASFKKYEKEIPAPEREKMLNSIREYHDKFKLVERK